MSSFPGCSSSTCLVWIKEISFSFSCSSDCTAAVSLEQETPDRELELLKKSTEITRLSDGARFADLDTMSSPTLTLFEFDAHHARLGTTELKKRTFHVFVTCVSSSCNCCYRGVLFAPHFCFLILLFYCQTNCHLLTCSISFLVLIIIMRSKERWLERWLARMTWMKFVLLLLLSLVSLVLFTVFCCIRVRIAFCHHFWYYDAMTCSWSDSRRVSWWSYPLKGSSPMKRCFEWRTGLLPPSQCQSITRFLTFFFFISREAIKR